MSFRKARPRVSDLQTGREVITSGTMTVDTMDESHTNDWKNRKGEKEISQDSRRLILSWKQRNGN
jgi:hypothetical protein